MKKLIKIVISLICFIGALVGLVDTYITYRVEPFITIPAVIMCFTIYITGLLLVSYTIKTLKQIGRKHLIIFDSRDVIYVCIALITILNSSLIYTPNEQTFDYIASICSGYKAKMRCTQVAPTGKEKIEFNYKVTEEYKNKGKWKNVYTHAGTVNSAYELLSVAKIYNTDGVIIMNKDFTLPNKEGKEITYRVNEVISISEFSDLLSYIKETQNY